MVDEIVNHELPRLIDRFPSIFHTIFKNKACYRYFTPIKAFYMWEVLNNIHYISRYDSIYFILHKKKIEKNCVCNGFGGKNAIFWRLRLIKGQNIRAGRRAKLAKLRKIEFCQIIQKNWKIETRVLLNFIFIRKNNAFS